MHSSIFKSVVVCELSQYAVCSSNLHVQFAIEKFGRIKRIFTPASGRNGAYFTLIPLITEPIGAYIWLFFGI